MTSILDQVARSSSPRRQGRFRPSSQREYFALRLAQHLGEPSAAQHYVELSDQYSEPHLLIAYRRAIESGGTQLASSFHRELERIKGSRGATGDVRRLAAIRIERRTIAVALLSGEHAEHTHVRHLSSDSSKALESAAAFISRLCDRFRFPSAALETLLSTEQTLRLSLRRVITEVLNERSVSIWSVSKKEVFAALAHPSLRSRREVREIIDAIYPLLNGSYGAPLVRDALALGLYCQTERHFVN